MALGYCADSLLFGVVIVDQIILRCGTIEVKGQQPRVLEVKVRRLPTFVLFVCVDIAQSLFRFMFSAAIGLVSESV